MLHSWFVQRDDGLILRTLSPNLALTPKLQHPNKKDILSGLGSCQGYRSSMKAAPIMAVGRMAQRNNFTAEIPSSPNRETKID